MVGTPDTTDERLRFAQRGVKSWAQVWVNATQGKDLTGEACPVNEYEITIVCDTRNVCNRYLCVSVRACVGDKEKRKSIS